MPESCSSAARAPSCVGWPPIVDPAAPRCVESAFAAYVIMLCYDFKNGGIVPSARHSRFASIVQSLGMDTIPVSRWNYDELQFKMLEAVKPACKFERELAGLDLSDPR